MITAVVLARNEAAFIGGCLESLRLLTDDFLVIDSHSSDGTVDIAIELGARVEVHAWQGFARTRNFALDRCRESDWVLFLDADERVTPELAAEIREIARVASSDAAGFLIPRRNVICGRVMRAGGWWPDYQLRLMRPTRCRYDDDVEVHEVARCSGSTFALNTPLVHLNYRTWREFFSKQIQFARLAAGNGPVPRQRAYLGAPARTFWRHFVSQRGVLDGLHGLMAAGLLGMAEFYRVWQARRAGA